MTGTASARLFSLVVLLTAGFSPAQERRLSTELNVKLRELSASSQRKAEMLDVIIQFRRAAHLQSHVARIEAMGAVRKNSLDVIQAGAFRIPVGLLPVLAQDPEIIYISPDRTVTRSSWDYMLDASQATAALKLGYSGNGVGIAVIDSGVSANLIDLQNPATGASRVVYSQSFVSGPVQFASIQSFPNWQTGTAYTVGATVMYNGVSYQCLQAHTSQSGWEPPNAPALWQAIGDGTGNWQVNTGYAVGELAIYNGNIYRCLQAHTSLAGWAPPIVPALWQLVGSATGPAAALDFYGHGTHVAGILAGNGAASGGWMSGVAPNANLIDLRVLDANGAGVDSAVILAIQQAIQLKNAYNIRVINLSLGRPVFESYILDPVCQAAEQAWKAGIVVVVAAGNYGRNNSANGYATITAPGNDPYVITVGATNTHDTDPVSDDTVATYSSKGPTLLDHVIKPDLVAPGNGIVSLLANGSTLDRTYPAAEVPPGAYGSNASTASYFVLSGTSMATPVVSGVVALMLERTPSLTPDQVKIRLMKTAGKAYPAYTSGTSTAGTYYSLQNDIFEVGAGYVNAYAAVTSNDLPAGTSRSPLALRDLYGNVHLQADPSSAWANSITWGSSIVWGNNVLQANSIVWGSSIVWGNRADTGYSIVWGTSIVWGVNVSFSESGDSDKN